MLRSKWVMLCPMARSGSSHTSELLNQRDGLLSHHGLFNNGPFGRWPATPLIPPEKKDYYSCILDKNYVRIGGQEHSGEFLDKYIFTDDPQFNLEGWECIGFKIQFVHFVHMPDLREYLINNRDIKIIVNTRRHLLEHTCAEYWCQHGNSRATRAGKSYTFGKTEPISVNPVEIGATFRNLCRYRQYAIETFDDGKRNFLEWSYEDMFHENGTINRENHQKLFDFLEIKLSSDFEASFSQTPRPSAKEYFLNFEEIAQFMRHSDGGVFQKYFSDDYDPRKDTTWPVLQEYWLDKIMTEKDNDAFRNY